MAGTHSKTGAKLARINGCEGCMNRCKHMGLTSFDGGGKGLFGCNHQSWTFPILNK